MSGLNSAQRAFIEQRVLAIRLEVLRRILLATPFYPGGKALPLTVSAFGDLHDYCDANTLGGLCDEDVRAAGNALFPDVAPGADDFSTQGYMLAANAVQSTVDQWLASGQMLDDVVLVAKLRLQPSQIEQLCDPSTVGDTLLMIDDLQARLGEGLGVIAETCDRLRRIVGAVTEDKAA